MNRALDYLGKADDRCRYLGYLVVLIDTEGEERHNNLFQQVIGFSITGDCDVLVDRIYSVFGDFKQTLEVGERLGGGRVSEEIIDVTMLARELLDTTKELYGLLG